VATETRSELSLLNTSLDHGMLIGGSSMNISRDTVKRLVNSSQSKISAIRLSPDEIQLDRANTLKAIKSDLDRKSKSGREITVIIVEF
jgi:hypothetical protein